MCSLENTKCQKCGTEENLTRHHVIPTCISKPIREIKNLYPKRVYVILCETCHEKYEKRARGYKNKLLQQTMSNFKEKMSLQGKTLTYLKKKDRKDILTFVVNAVGNVSKYSMERYSKLHLEAIMYRRMAKRMTVEECINLGHVWINHFQNCTGVKLDNSQYKLVEWHEKRVECENDNTDDFVGVLCQG